MKPRTVLRLLSALVVLALAGCGGATTQAGAEAGAAVAPAEGQMVVRIQNNLIPPSSLTVYAVPETGVRQMLGVMQPSETKTFTLDPSLATTQYRLVAEATGGQEIASREFTFAGTSGVTWDMNLNVINPIT